MKKTILALALASCTTLRGATTLESMSETQYAGYLERAAAQVGSLAGAAAAQGGLSKEMAQNLAAAIRGAVAGTVTGIVPALSGQLDLSTYEGVGMVLALTELDARLEELGAYGEGGVLSERGEGVLLAVAAAIEKATTE